MKTDRMTAAYLGAFIIALSLWTVGMLGAQPAAPPQPTAQDVVTNQIALELGRLVIENRTLNVSVEVLRGRIAELEKQIKDAQAKCEAPPQ